MAIAKKGLRKIIVDNEVYFYKFIRLDKMHNLQSDKQTMLKNKLWNNRIYAKNFVDKNTVIEIANIGIIILSSQMNTSKLVIKIHIPLIEDLFGFEKYIKITPKLISQFIQNALLKGWQPHSTADYYLTFYQNNIDIRQPTIDQLEFEPKENTAENHFNLRASRGNIERGMELLDKALGS